MRAATIGTESKRLIFVQDGPPEDGPQSDPPEEPAVFAPGYDPGELAESAQHMMREGGRNDKSLVDRVRDKL
jgi:hypothetical protein